MNDVLKIIGFGVAVGGLILAAKSLASEFETVEKRGLTLAGGIALLGLGVTVATRFDEVEKRFRNLSA